MRSIFLAFVVTTYAMLDLGQPMLAYHPDKLAGQYLVCRPNHGEKLSTLARTAHNLTAEVLPLTHAASRTRGPPLLLLGLRSCRAASPPPRRLLQPRCPLSPRPNGRLTLRLRIHTRC
ncbi:UNVERIFIED_CONTAM: hypothetical protein DV099_10475 [Bifidobacterium longum]|nr:hypothetical protein [Bifidobacterium longum]